jgi:hypothetical protein
MFPDEADAVACWRMRESKTWAVDFQPDPARRLAYRQTVYARALRPRQEIYLVPPRAA